MTRTDADKQRTIDRLTLAAKPSQDGTLYVRAATACRIIGVCDGQRGRWEKSGKIKARRFRVTPRRGASIGIVVVWPLDQVIACAKERRSLTERKWSQADDNKLIDGLGVVRVEVLAKRLGRTIRAVQNRSVRLGITVWSNGGKLSTGTVAQICGRSQSAVNAWCMRKGLVYKRLPGRRGDKLIKPENLYAFLTSRPKIWDGLSEASRRQIERMARDVAAPQPSTQSVRVPRVHRRAA